MRDSGAWTAAQDEQACAVSGMPKEAILCGTPKQVLSLDCIAHAMIQ